MDGYSINKTEFGERIKSAREELKMTQTQLAQLLKTSQTTVAKYEHGEQIPRADVLATISKATGKSTEIISKLQLSKPMNQSPMKTAILFFDKRGDYYAKQ